MGGRTAYNLRMASGTARKPRKTPTEAESKLWTRLRRQQLGGFRFSRQHPVGRYVVDFVCLERRIIVEVDGGQDTANADAARTLWLEAQPFGVLRFWNNEVLSNIDGVIETIRRALSDPPPHPSPTRAEGD